MNVIVQSKTLVVTEGIRQFILQQSRRILKHSGKVGKVTVFLEKIARKKNDSHAAVAKFHIDLPGKNVTVQEKAADLYYAIGQAAKAATRQVEKMKERRIRHLAR